MNQRFSSRGFTLMELMVVIVIVAILAAVAVPLYVNYVKDAKRTEAKGAIAAVISAEQIYFQTNGAYVDDDNLTDATGLKVDLTELARSWGVAVTGSTADQFKVTATGTGDADGLFVCCTYNRNTGATWGDTEAECGS